MPQSCTCYYLFLPGILQCTLLGYQSELPTLPYLCLHQVESYYITGTKTYENITPMLVNLYWLPVEFYIDFKILMITFKALNGIAPNYIIDLLTPFVPVRSLRSVDGAPLVISKSSWLVTKGDRGLCR